MAQSCLSPTAATGVAAYCTITKVDLYSDSHSPGQAAGVKPGEGKAVQITEEQFMKIMVPPVLLNRPFKTTRLCSLTSHPHTCRSGRKKSRTNEAHRMMSERLCGLGSVLWPCDDC